MLTDLFHNVEISLLEQAFLSDLQFNFELERIEKSFKTASDRLQELINQFN